VVRKLPSVTGKEGTLPSPLFNLLFLVALFVPIGMYAIGVLILMASLVKKHWIAKEIATHPIAATAH
jgi:hypothetical protein